MMIWIRENVSCNRIIFKAEAHGVNCRDSAKIQYMLVTAGKWTKNKQIHQPCIHVWENRERIVWSRYRSICTLYSDCILKIIVNNINNIISVFTKNNFSQVVWVHTRHVIMIVTVMDTDVDENSKLLYSLGTDNLLNINHLMRIVQLASRLDYKECQLYSLVVLVEDLGTRSIQMQGCSSIYVFSKHSYLSNYPLQRLYAKLLITFLILTF